MIKMNIFLIERHEVQNTVEISNKNIVSRKTCYYNRYVLIKGKINRGTYRNASSEDVLINSMF